MSSDQRHRTVQPGHATCSGVPSADVDYDDVPMTLYALGNRASWDPADIDFSRDVEDLSGMPAAERQVALLLVARFLDAEQSLAHAMQPFCSAVAAEGRISDELYLTQFVFEAARHTDGLRRFLRAVGGPGVDPGRHADDSESYLQIFRDELPASLCALAEEPSPAQQVRASVTASQIIQGCLLLTGYSALTAVCERRDVLPGLRELMRRIAADERRHIAWGTFTCRRHVAVDDTNWAVVDERMQELLTPALRLITGSFEPDELDLTAFGISADELTDYALDKVNRRLALIQGARTQAPGAVEQDPSSWELEEQFHVEDMRRHGAREAPASSVGPTEVPRATVRSAPRPRAASTASC